MSGVRVPVKIFRKPEMMDIYGSVFTYVELLCTLDAKSFYEDGSSLPPTPQAKQITVPIIRLCKREGIGPTKEYYYVICDELFNEVWNAMCMEKHINEKEISTLREIIKGFKTLSFIERLRFLFTGKTGR